MRGRRPGRALASLLGAVVLAGCAAVPDIGEPAAAGDPLAGSLILRNGQRHTIRFDALRYTGTARFEWPDGRTYEGEFVAGQPDGRGVEERTDGSRYEGDFADGLRHGHGELRLADGSTYSGDFDRDRQSGHGVRVGLSGRYDGAWLDDVPHGRGRFDYPDGSRYDGEWAYGRRSGLGRFERDDGSSYEGDWEDDLPNGFGTLQEPTGVTYEGALRDGERSGYGALDVGDGVGYEGMWLANRHHGWGRETRPDGSTYVGEWRDDLRHGSGTERHLDGSYHDGTWEADRPLGLGTRRTADGVEISGLWNGNFVASGVVRLPGGEEYAGNLYASANRKVDARFLTWLEARAAAEDAGAQCLLGDAYRRFAMPPPDLAVAARWYARAAAHGSAEAAFRLADVIAEREGVNDRVIEALESAAARGHARANARLGAFHQFGNHLPKDHARARLRYEAAMKAGDLAARNNLAWLLATTPDDAIRDGPLAVRLASPTALFYDHWTYLDTLAAAYAEAGDFAAARRAAARAIALAEGDAPEEAIAGMRARLEGFEHGEPYREP